jgi:hypothetical protein
MFSKINNQSMENLETANVVGPKKRGRKPGSKNKVKTTRTAKKVSYLNAFSFLEQEIQSLSEALKKATIQAGKEIEKLEKKHAKDIEKIKAKSVKSLGIWKERAKKNLKKAKTTTGRRGRPAKPKVEKEAARRGRPPKNEFRKGGGRRKAGELTKRDIILNYVKEINQPIATGDLIAALHERSGVRDKKRFSQGMYTTLTQMYKSGSLVKTDGIVTLGAEG